ncbi:hypothetical protein [Streptomyces sp. NPDC059874]|uniref:hypothetical protein n=1 Tax=Streptomyces sp. NPDC059874 TaxID=3346983 RepID=UPI0036591818
MARVEGFEPNHSGQQPVDSGANPVPVGVWGDSDIGVGVSGTSGTVPVGVTDIPTIAAGVSGHGFASPGVVGRSRTESGVDGESLDSIGVLGRSTNANGILGVTFTATPGDASAVFGSSVGEGNGVTGFVGSQTGVVGSSVRGTGVHGSSQGIGVVGENISGRGAAPGVLGTSEEGPGVRGRSDKWTGVFGTSGTGPGVRGQSDTGAGVSGLSTVDSSGVDGLNFSAQSGVGVSGTSILGTGVYGLSFAGTGVYGQSRDGYAGDFAGDVRVSGSLSKGGGGFEIDHPLDPRHMMLAHSFVESPEMLNVYSGTVTTDEAGTAEVALPDYFEALNQDYRYQLTVIGEFAQAIVGDEVRDNRFTIRTDRARIRVCWQVTGVRRDRWAEAHRITVESTKPEPGYRHPEVWDTVAQQDAGERLRRAVAERLPEEVREGADELLRRGGIDPEELGALVDTLRGGSGEWVRTTPEEFEEQWRRVQELVRRTGPDRA